MVMIAAAVGVAAKWFGSRRDDAGQEVQGDGPIVRSLLAAVNEGDLDGLDGCVHADCRVTLNSLEITRGRGLDRGPQLFAAAIVDLREVFPDVHWELYDELVAHDEGAEKVAIRVVSTLTIDGVKTEMEVAGFGIVEDEKLTEWHQVADLDAYNERRIRTGEVAIERAME